MSAGWEIGDLAVCVRENDPDALIKRITGPVPQIGATYRVLDIRPYVTGLWLVLDGAPDCLEGPANWGPMWFAPRFRKISPDEPTACEAEFVTLLKRSKQPAPVAAEHSAYGMGVK